MLEAGGVAAIPTDTVYGLAALPADSGAIDRIYEAKDRPAEKALPMLVASMEVAERIGRLPVNVRALCAELWPGALTAVVQAAADFRSPALAEDGTVALRMPASDLALEIIAGAGGVLAVTSANRSGEPPATTAEEVLAALDGRIDIVVDGGRCEGGVASTVVRVTEEQIEILREGAISDATLRAVLARRST